MEEATGGRQLWGNTEALVRAGVRLLPTEADQKKLPSLIKFALLEIREHKVCPLPAGSRPPPSY